MRLSKDTNNEITERRNIKSLQLLFNLTISLLDCIDLVSSAIVDKQTKNKS